MNTPLRTTILQCVDAVGDPLMEHIIEFCRKFEFTEEDIRNEVRSMVTENELRMKEDDVDHDWAYHKGDEFGAPH